MISVIIRHDGEDSVIQLTYENLWRELKDIEGAQIIVSWSWFDDLDQVKNKFVCFVEADCLVSSGYFASQLGLLEKNSQNRHIAVMASSTAVGVWANRFYGYDVDSDHVDGVLPNKEKKSSTPYTVEVAYIPGALIRLATLKHLIEEQERIQSWERDLVQLSTNMSLNFWGRGVGNSIGMMVYINPNTTYVTTEKYVNDISKFDPDVKNTEAVLAMFRQHSI
jgi:hypothetical protein